jgi:hypothetical protein
MVAPPDRHGQGRDTLRQVFLERVDQLLEEILVAVDPSEGE